MAIPITRPADGTLLAPSAATAFLVTATANGSHITHVVTGTLLGMKGGDMKHHTWTKAYPGTIPARLVHEVTLGIDGFFVSLGCAQHFLPSPKHNKPSTMCSSSAQIQTDSSESLHTVCLHSQPALWQSGEAYGLLSQNNIFKCIEKST